MATRYAHGSAVRQAFLGRGWAQLACVLAACGCGPVGPVAEDKLDGVAFLVRIEGHDVIRWPDSGAARGQVGAGSLVLNAGAPDGMYVLGADLQSAAGDDGQSVSSAARDSERLLWWGSRATGGGPFASSGLLNLPQTRRPTMCALLPRLDVLRGTLHGREMSLGVTNSVIARERDVVLSTGTSCRAAAVIDCLTATFAALPELPPVVGGSRPEDSGPRAGHPALAVGPAARLGSCFVDGGEDADTQGTRAFVIRDHRIYFAPERVFSILIYEGVWDNLALALGAGPPAAAVPFATGCGTAGVKGGCLRSPLPLKACVGCSELKTGKSYSAFLLLRSGALDESETPVVFQSGD